MTITKINHQNYTNKMSYRQMVLPLDYGVMISENEPVRLLDAVLEELDYTELQHLYSSKGRKSAVPPKIFFKIYTFAMLEGIISVRKMARQCEVNLQYKWLLDGHKTPSHMAFQRFFSKLTLGVVNNLFTQLLERIALSDSITFNEVFIDGTKFEANANKYTFVWRKNVERQLTKIPVKLAILKKDILQETGTDVTSLNDELLLVYLENMCKDRQITFVSGVGHRKAVLQKLFERALELHNKRLEYEKHLEILGERNSYSKTDHAATFMRMKEDHMLNGQLKAGYNVQIGVHSEYIMGVGVFPNPTDTKTLIPFVQALESLHTHKFTYIVADAGYDSNENFDWLDTHHYLSCIKPRYYERAKTRKYKEDIGRASNMDYDEKKDQYICANGRKLIFKGITKRKSPSGYVYEQRRYQSQTCNRCQLRAKCQPSRTGNKAKAPKQLLVSPKYLDHLAANQNRFTSDIGIQLRVNRSIQVEGVFGVVKEDINFRRLHHRGKETVQKFLTLLAVGFNLKKLHNRIQTGRAGKSLFNIKEIA